MKQRQRLGRVVFLALVLVLSFASRSPAGSLGVANDFNGFIFGNLSAVGGDTEGRLAVGGNFYATNYAVGAGGIGPPLPNSHGTRDDLIVGGNLNAPGMWQVFYGSAVWGTSLTAAPTTPNGSTFQGTPIDFAAAQADLTAKSLAWATLPANGTSVFQYSTLTLTGTDPTMNVFNVNASQWGSASDRQINVPVGSTTLINISGTSVSQQGGLHVNGSSSPTNPQGAYVLYNYPEATNVEIKYIGVIGSVLAPFAHLKLQSSGINGVGIAASAEQIEGGEFHNFTFSGNIVPEPASMVLLLGGLLAVASMVWHSQRSRRKHCVPVMSKSKASTSARRRIAKRG